MQFAKIRWGKNTHQIERFSLCWLPCQFIPAASLSQCPSVFQVTVLGSQFSDIFTSLPFTSHSVSCITQQSVIVIWVLNLQLDVWVLNGGMERSVKSSVNSYFSLWKHLFPTKFVGIVYSLHFYICWWEDFSCMCSVGFLFPCNCWVYNVTTNEQVGKMTREVQVSKHFVLFASSSLFVCFNIICTFHLIIASTSFKVGHNVFFSCEVHRRLKCKSVLVVFVFQSR